MSTFRVGEVYRLRHGGGEVRCVRRYFGGAEGTLEMIDLAWADDLSGAPTPYFSRTAMTMGDLVLPLVSDTLGGVLRPSACDHRHGRRFVADAGPNSGRECCSLCGGEVPPAAARCVCCPPTT